MLKILYHVLFSLFTLYVFIECTSYAIFEIKSQNNKLGGVTVITFTLFCIIIGNIVIWTT